MPSKSQHFTRSEENPQNVRGNFGVFPQILGTTIIFLTTLGKTSKFTQSSPGVPQGNGIELIWDTDFFTEPQRPCLDLDKIQKTT